MTEHKIRTDEIPTWVGPMFDDESGFTIEWNDKNGTRVLSFESNGTVEFDLFDSDGKLTETHQWRHPIAVENERLRKENASLVEELIDEWMLSYMEHTAESGSDKAPSSQGWRSTDATQSAVYVCDRLVDYGKLEKHS